MLFGAPHYRDYNPCYSGGAHYRDYNRCYSGPHTMLFRTPNYRDYNLCYSGPLTTETKIDVIPGALTTGTIIYAIPRAPRYRDYNLCYSGTHTMLFWAPHYRHYNLCYSGPYTVIPVAHTTGTIIHVTSGSTLQGL